MEKTGQQLQAIAERALAGQIGNGIAQVPAAGSSSTVSPAAAVMSLVCCPPLDALPDGQHRR